MFVGASMAVEVIPSFKGALAGNHIMRIFPNGPNTEKSIGGSICKVPPAWSDDRFVYCQSVKTGPYGHVIPFISSKGNGTAEFVAYMRNLLVNMPPWIKMLYLADWHEPEKDYGNGSASGITEYRQHQEKLWTMVQGLPSAIRAKVKFGIILTKQWTEDSGKGNFLYGKYDPGPKFGDFVGIDAYVLSNLGGDVVKPSTLPTPVEFLKHIRDYTNTTVAGVQDTRPRIFPELGLIGMPDDLDGTVRANWLQGVHDQLKTWRVGQPGWTKPWSFEGWIWWHTSGKATGEVPRIGQARDFPLHLRSVPEPSKTYVDSAGKTHWISHPEPLPNQAGKTQPAPIVTYNAIWTSENTPPPPDPDPDPVTPPPDPPPPYDPTGTRTWRMGATMKKADIAAYEAKLAGNQIFRVFPNSDGLPPAWSDPRFAYAKRAKAIPVVSSNIDGDSSKFTAMRNWIIAMPPASEIPYIYLSDRHEPENNVKDGLTREKYLANFKAWWDACIATLPAAIRSRVKAGPILTRQWVEDARKGDGDYTLYDPMVQLGLKTDVFMYDHYMDSWKPGSTENASLVADAYKDPVAFLASFKAYKAPTVNGVVDDRPRLLAELGAIGIPNDPDGTKRAAWITGLAKELDTWGPSTTGWEFHGAMWWNNQGTSGPSLTPIGTLRYFYLDKWQNSSGQLVNLPGSPPAPLAAYNQIIRTHGPNAPTPVPDPTPGGGTLSAGDDVTVQPGATFARTATEPTGVTITGRKWEILSGPMGAGTQIGTSATVSWRPGSSVAGSLDIRHPVFQEMAYRLTSIAENSTLDWTTAYGYIEDIGDQRGYTGGLVGFTSATGDMLTLVQQYATAKPGNALAEYIPELEECAAIGMGSGASAAAASKLGAPFIAAWKAAAADDPVFRKVQRDLRKSMYWDDALAQALADGVGPLGLAIYYDVLVNHGPGNDSESFGGILAHVRAANTKPSSNGNQTTWLNAITDRRNTILKGWGDTQQEIDGRVYMHRLLINGGTVGGTAQAANLNLVAPFKVSCYGDLFTITTRPEPVADSLAGTYVLRYTATGAGTDTVSVTVADTSVPPPDEEEPGGGTTTPPPSSPPPVAVPVDTPEGSRLLAASYTILVTNANLEVIGDPIHEWSSLQVTLRWKEPGSGQFVVPAYRYIREQLVPGCRIVVLRTVLGQQSILISGPMEEKLRERSDDGENGGVGKLTVTFADDMAWLAARLAYPDPMLAPAAQTTDYWVYNGNPEQGMLRLVRTQAAQEALPARRVPKLVTAAFSGLQGTGTIALGPTYDVNNRERLERLTDVLRRMSMMGYGSGYDPDSLGFRTRQTRVDGQDAILFEVIRSRNLAGQVHFSQEMGNLKYYAFTEKAPVLNHPIVGGAGDGADRYIQEFPATDPAQLAWGRYEGYVSRPGAEIAADQSIGKDAAAEALRERGASARLASNAADTVDCRAGVHYTVGDIVSLGLSPGEWVNAPVQTISFQAFPTAGEVVGTTIGDQSARYDSAWVRKMREMDRRIGGLERR